VPSQSMEPTVRRNERLVADMYYFRNHIPSRAEIVVIKKDGLFTLKRIAALPGDTIEGRDGAIYLNRAVIMEPYVQHLGVPDDQLTNFGPLKLDIDQYFVLGDNRDMSFDSRSQRYGQL